MEKRGCGLRLRSSPTPPGRSTKGRGASEEAPLHADWIGLRALLHSHRGPTTPGGHARLAYARVGVVPTTTGGLTHEVGGGRRVGAAGDRADPACRASRSTRARDYRRVIAEDAGVTAAAALRRTETATRVTRGLRATVGLICTRFATRRSDRRTVRTGLLLGEGGRPAEGTQYWRCPGHRRGRAQALDHATPRDPVLDLLV
jgi:hypothetical protein